MTFSLSLTKYNACISSLFVNDIKLTAIVKVNESRYRRCGAALHFAKTKN